MIRIFTKDTEIEINVIKNTLKVNSANDAFNDNVTVYHNKFPFLISEDKYTIAGLGDRHLLSIGRNQTTEVVVQFNKKTFFGKLKVLEYLTGARKCDLRFGSDLLSISDKKIATFMPVHHFGASIPYVESVDTYFEQAAFMPAIEAHSAKQYPEVNFALPQLYITDFYKKDEELYFQSHGFNRRGFPDTKFALNTRNLLFLNFYGIINFGSFVPMPYLMSLLEIPLASIGWQLKGNYKEDALNSKIIIIPTQNNNTRLRLNEGYKFDFLSFGSWVFTKLERVIPFSDLKIGNYSLITNLNNIIRPSIGITFLKVFIRKENDPSGIDDIFLVDHEFTDFSQDFNSDVEFKVDVNLSTDKLHIALSHPDNRLPSSHDFTITSSSRPPKDALLFHPTVELDRYVPDWTFMELINNLKEFQNLKSNIDETKKTITLDYNQKYITNFDFINITEEAVRITAFKNNEDTTYRVVFADEEVPSDETVTTIQNKFKTNTSTLSNFEKDGVTLALFNGGKNTATQIAGKTLLLDESNNSLQHLNFKDWFTFLKNASEITAVAHLSSNMINKIEVSEKIYFDKIMYAVKNMSYETGNELNKVTFKLNNILGVSSTAQSLIVEQTILITASITVAPGNVFSGGFFWRLDTSYTLAGFTSFDGVIIVKKLTQDPLLGVVYAGVEITNINVTDSGQFYIALIDIEAAQGWHEIQINYEGIFSNKFYTEVDTLVVAEPQRITLTTSFFDPLGTFSISFDSIAPSEVTLTLQEVVQGTSIPIGAPILSAISDFTLPKHLVVLPYAGSWSLIATAGTDYSNRIGWFRPI